MGGKYSHHVVVNKDLSYHTKYSKMETCIVSGGKNHIAFRIKKPNDFQSLIITIYSKLSHTELHVYVPDNLRSQVHIPHSKLDVEEGRKVYQFDRSAKYWSLVVGDFDKIVVTVK